MGGKCLFGIFQNTFFLITVPITFLEHFGNVHKSADAPIGGGDQSFSMVSAGGRWVTQVSADT